MKTSDATTAVPGTSVAISSLSMEYGGRRKVEALQHIDLDVQPHELMVILGPSGCGKTTLLRCVAGLEVPTGGEIRIGSDVVYRSEPRRVVPPNRRDIGMVFQNYALWPHMTVSRNVAYPLKARHRPKIERTRRVAEVLELVRCTDLADRLPSQLSGGQQQRVALARGLAASPALMLFDEPLSNLDAQLRIDLRTELKQLHEAVRFSGIYVTHDQEEALQLADRVAVMEKGRVIQVAPPAALYAAPATPYVARFLGIRNSFSHDGVSVRGQLHGRLAECLSNRFPIEPPFEVFVREQTVHVVPRSEPLPSHLIAVGGTVRNMMFGGGRTEYVIDCQGESVRSLREPDPRIQVGDEVQLGVDPDECLIYTNDALWVEGAVDPSTDRLECTESIHIPTPTSETR